MGGFHMKKVVIAGGTGFIGQYFAKQFHELGYEVYLISRKKKIVDGGSLNHDQNIISQTITWQDKTGIQQAIEGAELLINLAGKNVNCRYHEKNKQAIMNSRVETTTILGEAVQACQHPPELWINSSTATIYRHAEDRPMTEATGEIGSGFSVNVATTWEKTFFSFDLPNTRQIALRIAIVLGKNGGVIIPYKYLVKFGLGGKQGNGKQMFSWIHIADLFNIVMYLRDKKELSGVFNCAAPKPVTNQDLMKKLCETMRVPFGFPSPKWLLEIGAVLIRTETELILKSRWVLPERLEKVGYEFTYKTLDQAFQDILLV